MPVESKIHINIITKPHLVILQKFFKNNKMRFRDYIDVDYGLNRPKPVFRRQRCLDNWLCQSVCLK